MNPIEERLIAPTMLYRFSMDCRKLVGKWDNKTGVTLDESYRLPVFSQLDDRSPFADVRIAWMEKGLVLTLRVSGKQQTPWCRPTQLLESDGIQLWIDTRDTHNIHRASRFCHWFLVLPTGGGSRRDAPVASMLKINRARDFPKTFGQASPLAIAITTGDGYEMSIQIPSTALDGWNASEHRHLGFNYAVVDREMGWQCLAVGQEFPIAEDPSLWQTLALVD